MRHELADAVAVGDRIVEHREGGVVVGRLGVTKMSRSSVSGWRPRYRSRFGAVVVEHEHEPAAEVVDVGPAVGLDGGAERVGVALHVGHRDELLVVEHRVDLRPRRR